MCFKRYAIEIAVLVSGAAVMGLELTGVRVLAPHMGTSIVVWTSLIGVILASMSFGYWYGGKLADRKPRAEMLVLLLWSAAVWIGLVALLKTSVLFSIQRGIPDIRVGAILGTMLLFAPPSAFLAMIAPYAARLTFHELGDSGRTVGRLYALGTIGSIAGTFFAGFVLPIYLGNTRLLLGIASILFLAALPLVSRRLALLATGIGIFLLSAFFIAAIFVRLERAAGFIDIDTAYHRAWIYNALDPERVRTVKLLMLEKTPHSAIFLNDDELVFAYAKFFRIAAHLRPNMKRALMIGGGAYSYPRDFLARNPNARLDVVEIDPKLTEIAKQYFRLKEDPRLTIIHEDARTYLYGSENSYDVIFVDAFNSYYSVPYHLTTQEAVRSMYDRLDDGGAVIVNLVSALRGPKGLFAEAEYATYRSVFPQAYLFSVYAADPGTIQNVVLVALKSKEVPQWESADSEIEGYLRRRFKEEIPNRAVLTDDYAPVDYYVLKGTGFADRSFLHYDVSSLHP